MSVSRLEAKGFFASLFDFGFTSFVTLKFLKLIYTILVVLILLAGLVFLIAGLSRGGGTAVLFLILAPLTTLVYLIFARIYMEIVALFFRIGENTTLMATALTGSASGGSTSVSSMALPQPTYGAQYPGPQTYGGQPPMDVNKLEAPPPYGGRPQAQYGYQPEAPPPPPPPA